MEENELATLAGNESSAASEISQDVSKPEQKVEEKKEERMVPLAALEAERKKYQERISEYDKKLSKVDLVEQKLNQFYEEKNKQSEVNYEENPAEYLRRQQEVLAQGQKELSEQTRRINEASQTQAQINAVGRKIAGDEQAFLKKSPDYYNALEYVRTKEAERLQMAGYTPQEIQEVLSMGEFQTGAALLEKGQSPAEYVYNVAKMYGYVSQQKKAEDDLGRLEKGLQASKGTGTGSSLDTLMDKDESEIDKILFGS